MKWIKKDLIIKPEKNFNWMKTHAQLPVANKVEGDIFRIYFAGRNSENR